MKPSIRCPLWVLVLVLLFAPWGASAQSRATVNVPGGVDMDELGSDLRRALNAWEDAARSTLPTDWTLVSLVPGESVRVGRDVFLLVVESTSENPRLLVVGPDDPTDGVVKVGETATIGPLEVLLAQQISSLRRTEVLVRAAGSESSLLSDSSDSSNSPTRISGQEGPWSRIVIDSSDERAVAFSRTYLNERLRGQSREGAAFAARRDVPPRREGALEVGGLVGRAAPTGFDYRDPVNRDLPVDFDQGFHTANVTLHLIRGSSHALRTLSSSISYDSEGRTPDNPRVRAGTGPSGETDVRVGRPGDRWRGRLQAMEQSGEIRVESTTFLRVPLDGYGASTFRFDSRREGQSGAMSARRMGSDAVELTIDSRSGDWSNLGAVNTRVRVRDGGTVQLAGSTTTITRESRSGPPIIGSIPYGGPLIGSSSRSSYESDYALFASVTME